MITDIFIILDFKEFCDHAKVGDGSPNEILPIGTGRRTLAQRIYRARFGLASGHLNAVIKRFVPSIKPYRQQSLLECSWTARSKTTSIARLTHLWNAKCIAEFVNSEHVNLTCSTNCLFLLNLFFKHFYPFTKEIWSRQNSQISRINWLGTKRGDFKKRHQRK